MDHPKYTTVISERKKGQHLRAEDRGAIKILSKLGYSNRAIAQEIGCSPTTVGNELRLGTPARKSNKGGAPGYSPKLGEAVNRGYDPIDRLIILRSSFLLHLSPAPEYIPRCPPTCNERPGRFFPTQSLSQVPFCSCGLKRWN